MGMPLSPVPRPDITDGKGNLKAPWQAWFTQIYTFVSQPAAGGGGVVPFARKVATTAPLTGGGDLSADRTLSLSVNGVTSAFLAQAAAHTLKGNSTAATANEQDLTASQVKTLLAISLTTDVTGTLQAAQEPAHSGDVTNTAGSLVLTIQPNVVTNAKAAQMAAGTMKGNNTGSTSNATDLTVSQIKALLGVPAAGFPVTQQSSSYTLALTDANTGIAMVSGNVTIPANASVPIPIGSVVLIVNYTGAPLTISITTDTLFFAGTAGSGTRTLAAAGVATLYKTTATNWFCWGPGVT